jgi:hypothetical protein
MRISYEDDKCFYLDGSFNNTVGQAWDNDAISVSGELEPFTHEMKIEIREIRLVEGAWGN